MMRVLLTAVTLGFAVPALAQVPADPPAEATPSGEIWELDQLRVARDVPEAKLDALQPDHTMDAVIKRLTGMGIAFKRVHLKIFADKLPPKLKDALAALPEGEPFVLPDQDFWTVSVIVARTLPPGAVRFVPAPHPAQLRKA